MSNLTEKIAKSDEDLLAAKDSLVESTKLLEASPDDESLLNEVTELSNNVEKATETLTALKKAEAALAAKAEAVVAPKIVKSQHLGSTDAKDLFFKHATAKMIAFANKQNVEQVLEERYADQAHVKASFDYVAKTAVDPASTTTAGWAQELVQDSTQGFLDTLKTTSKRLRQLSNEDNFIYNGYIEGNNIMKGETNVIVTDGFTGNIALKTAEGTARFIIKNLKMSLTENLLTKISLIFSYFSLKKFKDKLDPRKYNGAIFLGLNGPVVKSHGGTDALGFYHSIDLCYKIIKGDLMIQIKKNLNHSKSV